MSAPPGKRPKRVRFVVYAVTCLVSGRQYVGVTRRDLALRMRELFYGAKRGSAHPASLSAAFREHGLRAFRIEPLAVCYGRDRAHELECQHVRKLKTLRPSGFNGSPGGPAGALPSP